MARFLPEGSPAFWHRTDGRPYTLTDSLLWGLHWGMTAQNVMTSQMGGNKDARMPAKEQPAFPWSPIETGGQLMSGDLGKHTPEEALDYLESL